MRYRFLLMSLLLLTGCRGLPAWRAPTPTPSKPPVRSVDHEEHTRQLLDYGVVVYDAMAAHTDVAEAPQGRAALGQVQAAVGLPARRLTVEADPGPVIDRSARAEEAHRRARAEWERAVADPAPERRLPFWRRAIGWLPWWAVIGAAVLLIMAPSPTVAFVHWLVRKKVEAIQTVAEEVSRRVRDGNSDKERRG